MNGYGTLLRLTLLNRLSALRPGSWRKENGKLDAGKIATVIGVALCGMMLAGMVVGLEWLIYQALSTLRHPELLPAMALLCAMLGMVLMSFFYVLSSLYFANDAVWMSYLPVKSRTVLMAKLTEIWAGEALIDLVLLLPAFILYGTHIGADAWYYLRAVVVAVLSPMLPIALITLLSTLLARVAGRIRNSAVLTSMLSFGMVLVVLVMEMTLMPTMPDDADAMWMIQLLVSREALLEQIAGFFPPVLWGIRGLQGSAGMLALYALVSFGSMALCVLVLGNGYLRLCVRQSEMGNKGRKAKVSARDLRVSSPLGALVRLEMRDILRSSVNLTQCLCGGVVFPLMLGVMLLGGSISEDLGVMGTALNSMFAEIPPTDTMLLLAAVIGFVLFVTPAAPTAVSREGERHALCRSFPVSPRMLLNAKMLCCLLLDAVIGVVTLLVLAAGLPLSVGLLLGAAALAALGRYAAVAFMLTVDTLHPLLHWTSEVQAIKQNMNVMLGMLVCILLLALPIALYVWLASSGVAPMVRFAAVAGVLVAEAALGHVCLRCVAEKKYVALEP